MSVFLTPELKPFVGGTYFPPEDSFGRPGFATILQSIAEKVCVIIATIMGVSSMQSQRFILRYTPFVSLVTD